MAEFVKAIAKADLTAGHGVMVELQGNKIAIFNVDETFYAVDDRCTHVGGPRSEGELEGTGVTCPWHGGAFDAKTVVPTVHPLQMAYEATRLRSKVKIYW